MIKTYKSNTGNSLTIDTSSIGGISTMMNMVNIHGTNGIYLTITTSDPKEVDTLHDEILKDWKDAVKSSKS